MDVVVPLPNGAAWKLEDVERKLALRGGLPGARVFDLAAAALRTAKDAGLATIERLPLALPASWCVNSPADSRVFRRWTLAPQSDVWLALVDLLEEPWAGPFRADDVEALLAGLAVLAPEARGVEALSKALALLVPERVPLMPAPAVAFVLGADAKADAASFIAMVDWFGGAVDAARPALEAWASSYREASLGPAQVLDRLLWFDSDGHRHFPRA
jgi:hypothetical protein